MRDRILAHFCCVLTLIFLPPSLQADDATWIGPDFGYWTSDSNWDPATGYPNAATDTATFDGTGGAEAEISATVISLHRAQVDQNQRIAFGLGSPTMDASELHFYDNGGNQGGVFGNAQMTFQLTEGGFYRLPARLYFHDTATAGTARIELDGLLLSSRESVLYFEDTATAGNASIVTNDVDITGRQGKIYFLNASSAANANITNAANNGNSQLIYFYDTSTADNVTLVITHAIDEDVITTDHEVTITNPISGNGKLTKEGSGTLILNGVNTYTGITTINEGTLEVGDASHAGAQMGSAGAATTVNANGTLSGYGTVVASTLTNSGTVAPGASIGTLTVTGNYSQNAGGTYAVEVDSNGHSDLLAVSGTASLNGTLSVDNSGGYVLNVPYTILTATGGVGGTFSTVTLSDAGIGYAITYDPNSVLLTFLQANPAIFTNLPEVAFTYDQRKVAQYLKDIEAAGLQVPSVLSTFFTSHPSLSAQRLALSQLSNANLANQSLSLGQTAYSSGFQDQIADRLSDFPSSGVENNAYTMPHQTEVKVHKILGADNVLWATFQGEHNTLDAADVSGLQTDSTGAALGVEHTFRKNTALGVAFSTQHFQTTTQGGGAQDATEYANARGELFQLGLYTRQAFAHHLRLGGAVTAGVTDNIDQQRRLDFANAQIRSRYLSSVFSEQMRFSYGALKDKIKPFVGVYHQNVLRGRYTEPGNTGLELTVNSSNDGTLRSQLGVMLQFPATSYFSVFSSFTWEHEFLEDHATFNAQLASVGGANFFNIDSVSIGRNWMDVKGGFQWLNHKNFSASMLYEGIFAQHWQQNGGRVQVTYHFS